MSTFTNWNGPECCGGVQPKTSGIIALTNAYTEMKEAFEEHVNAKVTEAEEVHNVKGYVDSKLVEIHNALDEKADAFTIDDTIKNDSTNPVQNKVIKAALAEKVSTTEADAKYLAKADYVIDNELDASSSNPVQNKIVQAAFAEKVSTTEADGKYATKAALAEKVSTTEADSKYATKEEVDTKLEDYSTTDDLEEEVITEKVLDPADDNIVSVRHIDEVRGTKELVFGDEKYKKISTPNRVFYGNTPYLTATDIQTLDKVGMITLWPIAVQNTEGAMIADKVPEGYLACDGSNVPADYPELNELLEGNPLPLIDYAIIKAKETVDIFNITGASGGSLAEAVALMHSLDESKTLSAVYLDYKKLPTDSETGTLALVYNGTDYIVYKKTESGWEAQ